MKVLLDTHVFPWYITGDARLPATFKAAIQDPAIDTFLSVASVWEAVVKYQIGKIPLPAPPAVFLPQQRASHGIVSLPVDEGALQHLATLPPLHRDPFDRMLVAQAIQYGLSIATVDPSVSAYSVAQLAPV